MKEKEFFTRVRERAALESTDEARAVTEATLRVLGSRLPEAEHLAAQLPESFGPVLTWDSGTGGETFDVDTFLECVHEREAEADRVDPDAERHIKAVALVLNEVVTDGTLSDVRAQLSDGYDRLFDPTGIEE